MQRRRKGGARGRAPHPGKPAPPPIAPKSEMLSLGSIFEKKSENWRSASSSGNLFCAPGNMSNIFFRLSIRLEQVLQEFKNMRDVRYGT